MKHSKRTMTRARATRSLSKRIFAAWPDRIFHCSHAGALWTSLAFAGGALCLPSAAAAQAAASLDGIVHDSSGALVPKASVQLKNASTGKILTTLSNKSGTFSISGIETGDYVLTIEAPGFQSSQIAGIHLDPGDQRTFRDIALSVGDTASITVTDVQGQVSTDSGETSTLISAEDIDHLAIEGRDVTELLKILPGFAIVTNSTTFSNSAYDPLNCHLRWSERCLLRQRDTGQLNRHPL